MSTVKSLANPNNYRPALDGNEWLVEYIPTGDYVAYDMGSEERCKAYIEAEVAFYQNVVAEREALFAAGGPDLRNM